MNELSPAGGITDFTGESSDWIELYNSGTETIMLEGYSITDDPAEPNKWTFPYVSIAPQSHRVILANGKDISVVSNNWDNGVPGFGYADGDDNTLVPAGTPSVFMRKEFELSSLEDLYWMYFYMDFDDGFIAYINGTEIARSENMLGHSGEHDEFANTYLEAVMYEGELPEDFVYDYESLLVEGTNVIAIQVHNFSSESSDLSAIPFLFASVNIATIDEQSDTDLPDWFLTPTFYFQTNFKLSKEGETIELRDNNGTLLDAVSYPLLKTDNSFGRAADGLDEWCLHLEPTPEESNLLFNNICYQEYAAQPILTPAPGFYGEELSVTVNCPDDDASAHIETDGSAATEDSDVMTETELDETKVISAKCYSASKAPSDNSTGTYFIDEPEFSLPVISLSTAPENLWDNETGIYVLGDDYESNYPYMGANFWQPWEKDAHFEMYDLSENRVVDINMALEIHGGWSRAEPQKSFRIDCKKSIDGHIEYPLMPRKGGINAYNNFNLRNAGQHAYGNRFQDAFIAQLISGKTDIDYMTHESSVVYLNGDFWGHYGIREKMDEHYIESNHGVNSNNVDLMTKEHALVGSSMHFEETVAIAENTTPSIPTFLTQMEERLDLDNYIDYYATEIHIQNLDWGGIGWLINNTKLWRPQTENGKWRFMLFDVDGALGNFGSGVNDNYLDFARYPAVPCLQSRLFNRMLINEEFKLRFINRYADLINTIFQPTYYNTVIDEIRDELENDMPEQIDRWSAPESMQVWYGSINNMRAHLAAREATSRTHIRDHFNLSAQRLIQINVQPAGAGRIQLNSISPDTYPWDGIYFQGVPITITAIPNPGYTFENWNANALLSDINAQSFSVDPTSAANFTANFSGSAVASDIIISEINYHSDENWDMGDWVELYNATDVPIDLANWQMSDSQFYNNFKLPPGTVIAPDGYLVLASDLEKFQSIHPWIPNVIGNFDFQFSNDGELISIRNQDDQEQDSVTYDDADPWPTKADGEGFTLELFDLTADSSEPGSWTDQCFLGSPGKAFNNACLTGIENSQTENLLNVFPNPVQDELTITLPPELQATYEISLKNELGKSYEIGKRHLESGSSLQLPKLPSGVYFLTLLNDEQRLVQKIVVQH